MSLTHRYRWKLVYEDGTEFTDRDGEPWESPAWGVVLVVQPSRYEDLIRGRAGGRGYYYYRTDYERWCYCDEVGMYDQMTSHAHHISAWRFGRNMPDRAEFKAIWEPYLAEVRDRNG